MAASWNRLGRVFGLGMNREKNQGRKSRRRGGTRVVQTALAVVETMEERRLLAAIAPTVGTNLDLSGGSGAGGTINNQGSPSIAYDPNNPSHMVAVYTQMVGTADQKVFIAGKYSVNSGTTWTAFTVPGNISDPQYSPARPYEWATDPTVAFDANSHFFVSYSERSQDYVSGTIMLQGYDFTAAAPAQTVSNTPVYRWFKADEAIAPAIAVDSNVASFTDPDVGTAVQSDVNTNYIYVAWASNDRGPTGGGGFTNGNVVKIAASIDGGATFGPSVAVSDTPYRNAHHMAAPKLVVTQGDVAGNVPGGQVMVVWDDYDGGGGKDWIMVDHNVDRGADTAVYETTVGSTTDAALTPAPVIIPPTPPVPVPPPPPGPYAAPAPRAILDAVTDAGGATVPIDSTYSLTVNINDPRFTTLTDLDVSIALQHNNLSEISIQLIPPSGPAIPLVALGGLGNNAGTALGVGASGPILDAGGFPDPRASAVFDDEAPRGIGDVNTPAPFVGHFQAQGGTLASLYGSNAAALSGTWQLVITDTAVSDNPTVAPTFFGWALSFRSGLSFGADVRAGTTAVRGAMTAPYADRPAVSPNQGIGPAPVIASDNTLGAFSPYQGRLYIAYTGGGGTNTDIFLISSDNDGKNWSQPVKVNDDNGTLDGFSGGNRAQFQPSLAVDQATGSVVLSFYDGRYDAAQARVATYIAYSVNGGATFAPETYANAPIAPVDVARADGSKVNVEPLADNFSAGNPNMEPLLGFGSHQGLIAFAGHVTPVWSGNLNGSLGNATTWGMDIFTSPVTIPNGPRILTSTMGTVGYDGDDLNLTGADGTRSLTQFEVVFDRPIDPDSFDISDVKLTYRAPGLTWADAGQDVPLLSVDPEDFGQWGPAQVDGATTFLITLQDAWTAAGTYSYIIGPDINDRIRYFGTALVSTGTVTNYTTAPSPINLSIPVFGTGGDTTNPNNNFTTSDITVAGAPAADLIYKISVNLDISHFDDEDLVLTLTHVETGNSVVLADMSRFRNSFFDFDFDGTTFDDDAAIAIAGGGSPFTGSVRPDQALAAFRGESPNGTWRLTIEDQVTGVSGTLDDWSIDIETGNRTFSEVDTKPMDQNGNATSDEALTPGSSIGDTYMVPTPANGTGFQAPFVGTAIPLIVPGPHLVDVTSSWEADNAQLNLVVPPVGTGGSANAADNTTLSTLTIPDDASTTGLEVDLFMQHTQYSDLTISLIGPNNVEVVLFDQHAGGGFMFATFSDSGEDAISTATAPFVGDYRPEQALSLFGLTTMKGTWTLKVVDHTAVNAGTLIDWSLSSTAGLYLNNKASSVQVTFDRDMDPATFTPASVLSMMGPAGPITGPFTVTPVTGSARSFIIGFPEQQLSGTYTLDLASSIMSNSGPALLIDGVDVNHLPLDSNLNAGLDGLRQDAVSINPSATTTTLVSVRYPSADTPLPLPLQGGSVTTSSITVPNQFTIAKATVQLSITEPKDSNLTAILIPPGGGPGILLFKGVGGSGKNFSNTLFDDSAPSLITSGGAPFTSSFKPQGGADAGLNVSGTLDSLKGSSSQGTWTLQVISSDTSITGQLINWSLNLSRLPVATGLGEAVADRPHVSFRIFTQGPTLDQSHQQWTAVGGAALEDGERSGRIGGLAVDPSDPSGNTVFVAGASGGVWKTTNFLTQDEAGPTWVPITDFGPTYAINIGGIAVFPRNNDTNQSIVFVGTGEGDTASASSRSPGGSQGVGFLRSMDGGKTWDVLDSTDNTLPLAARDHKLFGTATFKVLVDPNPTPTGQVIVYAAMTGANGGVWRSLDTGMHWTLMKAGDCTDIAFENNSGTFDAFSNPTGNLQALYAAFRTSDPNDPNKIGGVFRSANRGASWQRMLGNLAGDPLMLDVTDQPSPTAVPVNQPSDTPDSGTTNKGRIVLATPFLTGNAASDLAYQGWVYAGVVNANGNFNGLYMTKDFGQHWTKIQLTGYLNQGVMVPDNDPALAQLPVTGGQDGFAGQGNYDISLAINPLNPNIVYVGGTHDGSPLSYIRVDATGISDPYAFYLSASRADGGAVRPNVTDPINGGGDGQNSIGPTTSPNLNLYRDPTSPFGSNATILVNAVTTFANSGAGVKWLDWSLESTDHHRVVTYVDPVTRQARIIVGDDQGIYTFIDDDGAQEEGVDEAPSTIVDMARNGNLQITQFYYGAAQPSNLAAQIAGAYFYGQAQDNGSVSSSANVLISGDLNWSGAEGDGTGVATDQAPPHDPVNGSPVPSVYLYNWPCCNEAISNAHATDFFLVNGVTRTFGLIQAANAGTVPDPQWPYVAGSNFAVNPITGKQIVIGSQAGRLFGTIDQGLTWSVLAEPTALDGSYIPAMAFGAPDPNLPGGVDATNFFVYAGTSAGHIYVTQNGGTWTNISNGLDGSTVHMIITNPTRGSHEAFAVTTRGVYHIADSTSGQAWTNITGNLFDITHTFYGGYTDTILKELTSIQADWRYVIPLKNAQGVVTGTAPALYVGGEGGVFRSLDGGDDWSLFPNQSVDGSEADGGYLPNVHVSDMDMVLGEIDPATGRPQISTGPNLLLATTYGRGSFVIRLAPVVLGTVALDPTSDTGFFNDDGITADTTPTFTGSSMQTAFGSTVHVQIVDLDSNNAILGTGITREDGSFSVTVADNTWAADGSADGVKHLGIQAYDDAGTYGEPTPITITLQAAPPPAPSTPDLIAASDSGSSSTDNLTNVAKPTFTGTAQAGALVELLVNGGATVAGSGFADINGNYTITLTTSLAPDGAYNITARQTGLAGNMSAESAALAVTEDATAPVVTISPVAGVEGQVFTGTVAHFTDANPFGTALINWGDGTTSAGTIQANPNGGDDVIGTHTFQKAGSLNVEVDVTDLAGNLGTAVGSSNATVSNPAVVATGGLSVNAVEGQSTTGLVLATFTDPGVVQPLNNYSATIDWGDGSATSGGQISYNAQSGVFSVTGTHKYAEEGSFNISVTVHHVTGGAAAPDASATSTAAVSDPPVVGGVGLTIGAAEGTALGTRVVATFTDPGGAEPLTDYSATIDWGDGSSSDAGTIAATTGNSFSVTGNHTYDDDDTYTITVTINHDQTTPVIVTSTATITSVPPVASISGPNAARSGDDVTFSFGATDPSSLDNSSGFAYQINWGDGSGPTTFSQTAGNGGPNDADHVFSSPGTYTVTLTATDKDGASGTATTQITIANAQQAQSVEINNGDSQRSHINRIAFQIVGNNGPIRVSMSNLKLLFNGNTQVSLKKAKLSFNSATGMNVLTTKALNLADGDYQLQVRAAGQLVPIDFIKLEGDATGDGQVSRGDLNLVSHRGPGTDLNGDGRTDNKDLAIVRKDMNHSLKTSVNRTLSLVGTVPPNIPPLGFGTVRVGGAPQRLDVLIRNNGSNSLFFTGLTMPRSAFYDFAVLGTAWGRPAQDFELAPGDSITLRVYLNPVSAGKPSSSISLRYSDDGVHFSKLTLPIKAANLVLPTRAKH